MHRVGVDTITVQELFDLSQSQQVELIDVRAPDEFTAVRAPMAKNIPMNSADPVQVVLNRSGLPDEPIYFICAKGGRSERACKTFIAAGYPNVVNVVGGTEAWEKAGLPVERGA